MLQAFKCVVLNTRLYPRSTKLVGMVVVRCGGGGGGWGLGILASPSLSVHPSVDGMVSGFLSLIWNFNFTFAMHIPYDTFSKPIVIVCFTYQTQILSMARKFQSIFDLE